MGRKCSHCGKIGHNSRTCTNSKKMTSNSIANVVNGLRLFGVQLDMFSSSCSSSYSCSSPIAMKKSFSMDCLPSSSSSPCSSLSSSRVSISENSEKISIGHLSDALFGHPRDRKKGVPWSEDEHKAFLAGLEKLGKGDWRGISRNFVSTRTPTQVASHAQKYFLRKATLNDKKRRSSLFDMVSSDKMGNRNVNYSITKLRSSYLEANNPNRYYTQPSSPNRAMCHVMTLSSARDTVPVGIFGPFPCPNMNHSPVMTSPANDALDLELTLGASTTADRDKSPSNPLLIGPITVV